MREVVVVGYDRTALLDLAGPIEVFQAANHHLAPNLTGYRGRASQIGK